MKNRLFAIAGGRIMGEVCYEGGHLDFHYDPSWSDDVSTSQSLSVMTQFTWFFGCGPLVSHRSGREVLTPHMGGCAFGLVGIEEGLDGARAFEGTGDAF